MLIKKTKITVLDQTWKTVSKNGVYFSIFEAYCIVDKVGTDSSCGLFAIFDGHGGR